MKKIVVFLILSILSMGIKAQYMPHNLPTYDFKKWHFGFTIGGNYMDFSLRPVDKSKLSKNLLIIEPQGSQGFNIGIVANRRLFEYLDVRSVPTLSFGERSINYTFIENDTIIAKYTKKIESTYLDIPINFKYKSKRLPGNLGNVRTYVFGGFKYSYDFASQKRKNNNNGNIVIKLAPQDVQGSLGVGFDFYFKYFKLGCELQTSYGMMNLLVLEQNQFTLNVDKIYNHITWFTFTFE